MIDANTTTSFWQPKLPTSLAPTYYRSTLYTPTQGINPLVSAATPLLSLIPLIKETTDINQLHQVLAHEIRVFETNLQQANYRYETIMAARYALCATLDDVITHDTDGTLQNWQNCSLLHNFHQEQLEKNRFFMILERLQQSPDLHIELLELFYLCLNLGFQGTYRMAVDIHLAKQQLETLTHTLYECIRQVRYKTEKINILPVRNDAIATDFFRWLTAGFCCLLLVLTTMAFVYIFKMNLNPVYHTLEDINQQLVKGEEEY
ncbi:N/A [soil metagenome]